VRASACSLEDLHRYLDLIKRNVFSLLLFEPDRLNNKLDMQPLRRLSETAEM
jgi:hypothetical protein